MSSSSRPRRAISGFMLRGSSQVKNRARPIRPEVRVPKSRNSDQVRFNRDLGQRTCPCYSIVGPDQQPNLRSSKRTPCNVTAAQNRPEMTAVKKRGV